MSRAWARGSTRRWRMIRATVLANNLASNGGRCRAAIEGVCTGLADSVHHILGRSVSGDDPRYLEAVCMACNLRIGEPEPDPQPKTVTRW